MREPHVEALYYTVGSDESVIYTDPKPLSFSNYLGEFDLRNGMLTIRPSEHFEDAQAARQAMEPFLAAWQMEPDLTATFGTIRFTYDHSDIVDLDPPKPGGSVHVTIPAGHLSLTGHPVTLRRTFVNYPKPPNGFSASPLVQALYRRWLRYREGKEPLQGLAYFVLKQLELSAGGRGSAASAYAISTSVLKKIGRLATERGNQDTARKARQNYVDLSEREKNWLEAAVRRLIYRLGQHASGEALSEINLSDLPSL